MNNLRKSKLIIKPIYITTFLFILLFLSSFNSNSPALKPVGFISMLITLSLSCIFLLYLYVKSKKIHKSQFNILLTSFSFFLVMLVGLSRRIEFRSIETIFQFVTISGYLMFCSLIKWDDKTIKLAKKLSIPFIIMLPFIANITLIGAHILFGLFFVLIQNKKKVSSKFLILASLVLLYYTGARAVFLILIFALFTYKTWGFFSKNKKRFYLYFFAVIGSILSFIFLYPNIVFWSKYPQLNYWIYQYTGQNILTGRNIIWSILTDVIYQKPLLGHGTGVIPSYVSEVSKSSHNLYVQISLQNGLVGLFIFILLLFAIWKTYYDTKELFTTKMSASFFIGILIYNSFEVVLTQNKPETALMFWLIISIGLSNKIYYGKKSQSI